MKKNVTIIGAGISSLSTACFLAKEGYQVTILEKNKTIGGRARQFSTDGFVFDMGPSWYWMPDVFERFYNQFGYTTADFYELKRLDPSYRVFWDDDSFDDIPSDLETYKNWFEKLEPGSSKHLEQFLKEAKYKYEVGMNDLVHKPSLSWSEFLDGRIISGMFKLHLFSSFAKYIRKYFSHKKIISLLEFPVLFLGATPNETPALYSLMNYADIELGTWYPMGGMYKIIESFEKIAKGLGVTILTEEEVIGFNYSNNTITHTNTKNQSIQTDILISGADYNHTDKKLVPDYANYSENYWDKRVMAPSSLLFYVGVNKKIENLQHHNLFFDADFEEHAHNIYKAPDWPNNPLFYVCCPSKTDASVAPEGKENLFILVPIASNINDDESIRQKYFNSLIERIEKHTGCSIKNDIIYQKSYCISDFKKDYHAFKGNAYGLANTLLQTAILKPTLKNKKLKNMFYTGQLTVPGPGVPPSIISGEVVAKQVLKQF